MHTTITQHCDQKALQLMATREYTPALGYTPLTPLYDVAIATLTRESIWRSTLIDSISPSTGDRIMDVGCGTGSLAIRIKHTAPGASVVGLDPDPEVLARARAKAFKARAGVDWRNGFLNDQLVAELGPMNKVVSSLVLHQTPIAEKQNILRSMWLALASGGSLHIADYGLQRSRLMRSFFRATVQSIDGQIDTQPNADGVIPTLIEEAGFTNVNEVDVIPTLTGSISIYNACRSDS